MPRIGERGWIHSGVKVYDNTAAPTSWTDLDLSSVVGKNRALVFIKVKSITAMGGEIFHFRVKGETEAVAMSYESAAFNNIAGVTQGNIAHLVMETDNNGIIQWKGAMGGNDSIWVLGYIR